MFSNIISAFTFALFLSVLAAAMPMKRGGAGPQCSTGTLQCCKQVQSSKDMPAGMPGLALLQDLDLPVGLDCSPIDPFGAGSGSKCTAQAACCTDQSADGLFSTGCSPATYNF